ncbi:MAG: hypothetical protein CL610_23300 [Anaerolineaceae bacterium]|nr:hypothetical protein [Anaerolineaceae bacterium]
MALRQKTVVYIFATMIALLAILYVIAQQIVLTSFHSLESESVQANVERVYNSLTSELNSLNSTAADWAYWDDTYQYMLGNYEAFLSNNMSEATLVNLDLNFMLFLDTNDQYVYGEAIDLQSEAYVPLADDLLNRVSVVGSLLDEKNLTEAVSGFLETADGPVLVSARRILTNQSTGPAAGTLVIGWYLTPDKVHALSDQLRLDIHIHAASEAIIDEHDQVDVHPEHASGIFVEAVDAEMVYGYSYLEALNGENELLLHIEMPRTIYTQGQNTLQLFLIALVITGITFMLVMLLLVNHAVLDRLARLSETVTRIRETGDTSIQVMVQGKDEISNLGQGIQEMLAALARSQTSLQQSNNQLEQLVEKRTADLVQTNEALKHEVAERKQAQAELAQARDQALDALRLKTQILANISHDARTPLSVILLRASMLQSGRYGPITDVQNDKLESIIVNVNQLTGFINNLLDGAQMEESKIRLEWENIAPAQLLAHLDETARPLAHHKKLELTWAVDEDMPDMVTIDPGRFNQILANLVGNAIKFTKTGLVEARVYKHDNDNWALEVRDTGPGITPEAQERIFEAFWQVDGSLTREANRGVGLGLSIVKQLANLMNGSVVVESIVGAGTTFRVIFPLQYEKELAVNA